MSLTIHFIDIVDAALYDPLLVIYIRSLGFSILAIIVYRCSTVHNTNYFLFQLILTDELERSPSGTQLCIIDV